MNPKIDRYIAEQPRWQDELEKLREIILDCSLNEEMKWGAPCYTFRGSNVIGMHGFKEHFAVWFFKGALLKDPYKILVKPGGKTQAMMHIRFRSMEDIRKVGSRLKEYIFEAVEIEKAGLKVDFKKDSGPVLPAEFIDRLESSPELKAAFFKLTPGRQKDYGRHFSEAKHSKTRESRIEKCIPLILDGKGLNDKYIC